MRARRTTCPPLGRVKGKGRIKTNCGRKDVWSRASRLCGVEHSVYLIRTAAIRLGAGHIFSWRRAHWGHVSFGCGTAQTSVPAEAYTTNAASAAYQFLSIMHRAYELWLGHSVMKLNNQIEASDE